MSYVSAHNPIIMELIEAGVIPKQCRKFTIEAKIGTPVVITSEVFVTEEQFRVIADSLKRHGKDAARLQANLIVFNRQDRDGGEDARLEL